MRSGLLQVLHAKASIPNVDQSSDNFSKEEWAALHSQLRVLSKSSMMQGSQRRRCNTILQWVQSRADGETGMLSIPVSAEDMLQLISFPAWWPAHIDSRLFFDIARQRNVLVHQAYLQAISIDVVQRSIVPDVQRSILALASACDESDPDVAEISRSMASRISQVGQGETRRLAMRHIQWIEKCCERLCNLDHSNDMGLLKTRREPRLSSSVKTLIGSVVGKGGFGADDVRTAAVDAADTCAVLAARPSEPAFEDRRRATRVHVEDGEVLDKVIAAELLVSFVQYYRKGSGADEAVHGFEVLPMQEQIPLLHALRREAAGNPWIVEFFGAKNVGVALERVPESAVEMRDTNNAMSGFGVLHRCLRHALANAEQGDGNEETAGTDDAGAAGVTARTSWSDISNQDYSPGPLQLVTFMHVRVLLDTINTLLYEVVGGKYQHSRHNLLALERDDVRLYGRLEPQAEESKKRDPRKDDTLLHAIWDCVLFGMRHGDRSIVFAASRNIELLRRTEDAAISIARGPVLPAEPAQLSSPSARLAARSGAKHANAAAASGSSHDGSVASATKPGSPGGTGMQAPLDALVQCLTSVVTRGREVLKAERRRSRNSHRNRTAAESASGDGHGRGSNAAGRADGLHEIPSAAAAVEVGRIAHVRSVLAHVRQSFAEVLFDLLPSNLNLCRQGTACVVQRVQEQLDAIVSLLRYSNAEVWAMEWLRTHSIPSVASAAAPTRRSRSAASTAGSRGGSTMSASAAGAVRRPLIAGTPTSAHHGAASQSDRDDGGIHHCHDDYEHGSDDDDEDIADDDSDAGEGVTEGLLPLDVDLDEQEDILDDDASIVGSQQQYATSSSSSITAPSSAAARPASTTKPVRLPATTDAFGHPVNYSRTVELVRTLEMHVKMWAPARLKLLIVLRDASAGGTSDTAAINSDKLMQRLTPAVVQDLHCDVLRWFQDLALKNAAPTATSGGKKSKGGAAAAAAASGASAGEGDLFKRGTVDVSKARNQTLEGFLYDRHGIGAEQRSLELEMPSHIFTRARPTVQPRRNPQSSGLHASNPPAAAVGSAAASGASAAAAPPPRSSLERLLPDSLMYAAALDETRDNLRKYLRLRRENSDKATAGQASEAKGAAAADADSIANDIQSAMMGATMSLIFEDSDASYRPSNRQH